MNNCNSYKRVKAITQTVQKHSRVKWINQVQDGKRWITSMTMILSFTYQTCKIVQCFTFRFNFVAGYIEVKTIIFSKYISSIWIIMNGSEHFNGRVNEFYIFNRWTLNLCRMWVFSWTSLNMKGNRCKLLIKMNISKYQISTYYVLNWYWMFVWEFYKFNWKCEDL